MTPEKTMAQHRQIRIGMITPSSNSCLEPVTYRLLAEIPEVTAHFSRVPVTRISLEESADAQFGTDAMTAAARLLADVRVDVVVWNGTSGFWLGVEHDLELVRALEKATGVTATTSTLALLDACAAYGITRLGLATPYTGDVAARISETYAAHGVEVVAQSNLGISDNEAFGQVTPDQVAAQVREVAAGAHAAAVVCTNVHGAGVVAGLEAELGIPVLDSVAVTLWKALDLTAGTRPVAGFGTVLRDGTLRSRLQDICERLLKATGADRTTLRVDVPEHDLGVDLTAAEALRAGVRSIRREGSLDQRRLNTVEWLEKHRRDLVQPHFHGDPMPPAALIDVYGVHAQMLGPVEYDGDMPGWLSVHSLTERDWSDADIAALDRARSESAQALGMR